MGVSETNGAQPYLTPQIKNHPKVVLVARGGIDQGLGCVILLNVSCFHYFLNKRSHIVSP
jgi:hypothetical protein